MRRPLQIAIDGPVGAGKSTVARLLARRLGLLYWDTGAMYRAVAYLVIKNKINPKDEKAVLKTVKMSKLKFFPGKGKGRFRVILDGTEVTGRIRSEEVGKVVGEVAQLPKVREFLVGFQQKAVRGKGVVMEGRDIGTKVLPQAPVKIFLTGSFRERVRRKHREIKKRNRLLNFVKLYLEISRRDRIDRQREVDPLRVAKGAVVIDTTKINIDKVVVKIVKIMEEKIGKEEIDGVNN